MSGFLIFVAVVGGLVVLWLVVIFLASLLETQHVYEFVPMTAENEVAPTPYLAAMATQASQLGHVHGGEQRHVKYLLRVSLWAAPDRRTIAQVSGGKIAGMAVKKTRLFSRAGGGAVLVTTDESGLPDYTGLQTRQLVMNAPFHELHNAHANWLVAAESQGGVLAFEKDPATEMEAMEAELVARQEAFGYSRFVDRAKGTYKHTFKGALRNASVGLFKGFVESARQQARSNLPRPG